MPRTALVEFEELYKRLNIYCSTFASRHVVDPLVVALKDPQAQMSLAFSGVALEVWPDALLRMVPDKLDNLIILDAFLGPCVVYSSATRPRFTFCSGCSVTFLTLLKSTFLEDNYMKYAIDIYSRTYANYEKNTYSSLFLMIL